MFDHDSLLFQVIFVLADTYVCFLTLTRPSSLRIPKSQPEIAPGPGRAGRSRAAPGRSCGRRACRRPWWRCYGASELHWTHDGCAKPQLLVHCSNPRPRILNQLPFFLSKGPWRWPWPGLLFASRLQGPSPVARFTSLPSSVEYRAVWRSVAGGECHMGPLNRMKDG